MRILILLMCLMMLPCTVSAQERGDWALGQWQGGQFWFPGVIQSRTFDSVTIAYDDGTSETLPLSRVRPYNWIVGTSIECRWQNGSEWYAGKITRVSSDGTRIDVLYQDGDRENLATGACRSR